MKPLMPSKPSCTRQTFISYGVLNLLSFVFQPSTFTIFNCFWAPCCGTWAFSLYSIIYEPKTDNKLKLVTFSLLRSRREESSVDELDQLVRHKEFIFTMLACLVWTVEIAHWGNIKSHDYYLHFLDFSMISTVRYHHIYLTLLQLYVRSIPLSTTFLSALYYFPHPTPFFPQGKLPFLHLMNRVT